MLLINLRRMIYMEFSIKGENVLFKIEVEGRAYPEILNYWDINWLICNINIKIPGYIAEFSTYIRTDEFRSFYDEMKRMRDNLSGSAKLITMENGILIESKIDKLGHIEWQVETQYPEGTGATLNFDFVSNQSYLNEMLIELGEIIKDFPVLLGN